MASGPYDPDVYRRFAENLRGCLAGRRVVVETTEPWGGRVRFRGVLAGLAGGTVRVVEESGEEIGIPRERVSIAKQDAEADLRTSRRAPAGPERGAGVI